MKPIWVWIDDGTVWGVGDTGHEALAKAKAAVKELYAFLSDQGQNVRMPKRMKGYPLKLYARKYPAGEDPREALLDALSQESEEDLSFDDFDDLEDDDELDDDELDDDDLEGDDDDVTQGEVVDDEGLEDDDESDGPRVIDTDFAPHEGHGNGAESEHPGVVFRPIDDDETNVKPKPKPGSNGAAVEDHHQAGPERPDENGDVRAPEDSEGRKGSP